MPATVLIVDDESGILEIFQDILESRGHRVFATNNPERVPALLDEADGPIDVLLVDVIMPQMPGLEVAALVQQRWPGCRVVFMSGYSSEDLSARGIPADATLLPKPVEIPALIATVRAALDRPPVPG